MLELRDLRKRFGDVVALDGLSLTARPGGLHGFVGRNGAGKTTAMRIALGLERADGGAVLWRGAPVTADDRRGFGYMPEERGLYPAMTARRQTAWFARLAGMPADEAARAADAVLGRMGLDERADEPVERLSLGNQQRVQLAVALVTSPDLLVLDEPFSGLDPVGVDALADALRDEARRGAAILFSSHQLDLVERLCDEVTIIDAGRVVAAGETRELRRGRGRTRLRVGLHDGSTAWASSLDGSLARVVAVDGDEVVLEPLPGVDDQLVLDAALAAGPVRVFGPETPTLTDLYRAVVAP